MSDVVKKNNKRKTTFRVNRLKSNVNEIEEVLKSNGIKFDKNIDCEDAFILDYDFDKTSLENLDIYKEGKIYVQSLSSMKPVYILNPKASENILDMCAAPGSKTTMIQSITGNKVNLTAVELHKDRFMRLKYNCDLQGANVLLLNRNALDLDDMFKFDKILLDAPCSGSGTGDAIVDLKRLFDTQKKLVKKASKLLNKGGILIYSTCSIYKEENQDIVEYAVNNGFSVVDCEENNKFIEIKPDDIFEGFFISKLIRI